MRRASAKIGKRLLSAVLAVMLVLSILPSGMAQERVGDPTVDGDSLAVENENTTQAWEDMAMGALNTVTEQLMAAGFPRSYAERLAPLQLAHPSWSFEALIVPEDFSYVISMEVDDNPARNLISAGASYVGYRHPTNTALYDTGWYQASRETVMYFMDPRNFFNETDIFQFYRFSGVDAQGADMTVAVEAVLRGTFMEGTVLENGKTYAENFMEIGASLDLSPLYLAVKARQEQGVSGGFTSTGDAGQLLTKWLAAGEQGSEGHDAAALATLDGYYNIFNISASGTGKFRVLYGAMQRAIQGTPDMAQAWGGAAWDTVWKSIYGGAETVKTRYTANDQDTLYLQKFNVSPNAGRRFWGQYMQNVMGALSEGRSLYRAFDAAGAVDGACVFRIPVYTGISDEPYGDPCNGSSPYGGVATATLDFQGRIAAGECVDSFDATAVTLWTTVAADASFAISGSVSANVPISGVELTPVMKNGALITDIPQRIALCEETGEQVSFLSLAALPEGARVGDEWVFCISLRLDAAESYRCKRVALAYLTVQALTPEAVPVSVYDGQALLDVTLVAVGGQYELPAALPGVTDDVFVGWLVQGTQADGLYPPGASIPVAEYPVTLCAQRVELVTLPGAALVADGEGLTLAADCAVRREDYERISAYAQISPMILFMSGEDEPMPEKAVAQAAQGLQPSRGGGYLVARGQLDELSVEHREMPYAARAALQITYADGSTLLAVSRFDEVYHVRCARDVARAALSDDAAQYEDALRALLALYAQ